MIGEVRHRGPDAEGVLVATAAGLAHSRLSIIDLSPGGAQPMSNDDGTISITFNGEIFNYVELRDELIARGRRFRSTSDTEVIIRLYEEMGPDCVERLNGDFAFAIWDARRRQLMLARDRMGVRPLFYAKRGGALYFASEVKALLPVRAFDAELDPIALDQIFTLLVPARAAHDLQGHIRAAAGAPAGRECATACAFVATGRLDFPDAGDAGTDKRGPRTRSPRRCARCLIDATRIRLRSDVPVGAYLSGGLDSSMVAAMAGTVAPERLRTFSVRFDTPEFDETEFQLEMARALGTDHSAVLCRPSDIGAAFPDVIRHAERPILRTAPAPLQLLSGLVREEGFKVVLTGEGADEVFGGYDIFKEAKLRRFCAVEPQSLRRPLLFRKLYPYLPKLQAQSAAYLKAFFATDLDAIGDPLFSHLPRFRTTAGAKLFFSAELKQRAWPATTRSTSFARACPTNFMRWHPLSQAQYLETAHLLPGYILSSQGDRMAMANAVEGRFPFLDHRVVEMAARIPPSLKLRGLTEKHILRKAASDLVPRAWRSGRSSPTARRTALPSSARRRRPMSSGCLPGRRLSASGLFDRAAVEKLAAKARSGRAGGFRDNAALTGILSTQLWREAFVVAASNTNPVSIISRQRVA